MRARFTGGCAEARSLLVNASPAALAEERNSLRSTLILIPFLTLPQMLMQEPKRALPMNGVASIEVLNSCRIGQPELRVKPCNFCVLMRDPLISSHLIPMAALSHKGARNHQVGHFRIIKGAALIEIRHFPLDAVHETEPFIRGRYFSGPAIEIAGANRETVAFQNGRHANGCFPSIAEAIER